jgi:serine/threonine protein kinase/Flp pilus assembly protein TadD
MDDETDPGLDLGQNQPETTSEPPASRRPAAAAPLAGGATLGPEETAFPERRIDLHEPAVRIGQYRILRKLGEGGMGVVYEAEQQTPRRLVAVKVIRGGEFVDDTRVRLFQREADTLARLRHPNIGAIYEAGRTEDGQHFFAMELVPGDTLSSHLLARGPATASAEIRYRLALFRKITEAVHYAHQRGVIHRDLKPSNIIVGPESEPESSSPSRESSTGSDGLPDIKILDFGLARITDGDVAATQITEVGMIKGTLPYMSPEQAQGNTDAIDIRTDVYALGVILYEMLTGARPYEVLSGSLLEAIRVICEQPPPPLARRWAGKHRVDPDLETIVRTALAKDPGERYGSAAELADDVARYLAVQPILARPPSTLYQLRKLVARNRLPAALAATAAVVLVGVAILMSVLYREANRNLRRANAAEAQSAREAETARQVSDFMQSLFRQSNPRERPGGAVTLHEVLDQGAARVEKELAGQPVVQARLMNAIGSAYRDIGDYGPATRLIEGAWRRMRAALGPGSEETIPLQLSLSALLVFTNHFARAEELSRDALAAARALPGDHLDLIADATNNVAHALLQRGSGYAEAEKLLRSSLAAQRQRPDHENDLFAQAQMMLGWSLLSQGKLVAAEKVLRESLALRRKIHHGDHPSIGWTLNLLGTTLAKRGDDKGAEGAFHEALEMNRRLFGDVHPEIAYNLEGLAGVALHRGEYDRAVELQRHALALRRKVLQTDLPGLMGSLNNLAVMLWDKGDYGSATGALEEAISVARTMPGEHDSTVAVLLNNIGEMDMLRGDVAGAAKHYRESLDMLRSRFGESSQHLLIPMTNLAEATRRSGDAAAAEKLLSAALAIAGKTVKDSDARLGKLLTDQAKALLDLDRPKEARAAAERALKIRGATLPPGDWQTAETRSVLGACLARQGEFSEAESALRTAYRTLRTDKGPGDPYTEAARDRLIALYVAWHRPQEAKSLRIERNNTRTGS